MGSRDEPRSDLVRPTDEDLVLRARAGDEAAERLLFERHAPRLRRLVRQRLRGILRRKVGESDVVQEAYLAAHLRLVDFEDRGEGSYGRWLTQILEHKIHDELRRHLGTSKRDARLEESQDAGGPAPAPCSRDPSPSQVVMGQEERERLARAMAGLTDNQRLVLRMAHEEGLPLAEIARRLGKNAAAIYRMYGRAAEALAQRLAGSEEP